MVRRLRLNLGMSQLRLLRWWGNYTTRTTASLASHLVVVCSGLALKLGYTMDDRRFSLLRLPPELRLRIYEWYFLLSPQALVLRVGHGNTIPQNLDDQNLRKRHASAPALLLANKQIYHECQGTYKRKYSLCVVLVPLEARSDRFSWEALDLPTQKFNVDMIQFILDSSTLDQMEMANESLDRAERQFDFIKNFLDICNGAKTIQCRMEPTWFFIGNRSCNKIFITHCHRLLRSVGFPTLGTRSITSCRYDVRSRARVFEHHVGDSSQLGTTPAPG